MTTDLEGAVSLKIVRDWLSELPTLDLEDVTADGGVTVGMVIQQQATLMASKLAHTLDALASITRERDEARALLGVESINGVLGYCLDQDRCGCGGDVPAIRATCDNWCKLKEQAAALVNGEVG